MTIPPTRVKMATIPAGKCTTAHWNGEMTARYRGDIGSWVRWIPAVGWACVVFLQSPGAWAQAKGPHVPDSSYRVGIELEQLDATHWDVLVQMVNPGPVAAVTLPFRWGDGRAPYRIDSADYDGMRTEYFALKTYYVDSTKQTILIGLISDMGAGLPPLEAGGGGIARLYFTARRTTDVPLTIDTTFIPPANTLRLVTPDVKAISPLFMRKVRK